MLVNTFFYSISWRKEPNLFETFLIQAEHKASFCSWWYITAFKLWVCGFFCQPVVAWKKRLSSHRRDQGRRACVLLHCVHHFYSLIPQARTTWTMLFLLIVKTKTVFLRSPNPSQEKKPDTSATFDPLPIPYRFVGPMGWICYDCIINFPCFSLFPKVSTG